MPERLVTMGKFIEFSLVSRKELQHMLHSRRKAEIEVLSGIRFEGTGKSCRVSTTLALYHHTDIISREQYL